MKTSISGDYAVAQRAISFERSTFGIVVGGKVLPLIAGTTIAEINTKGALNY